MRSRLVGLGETRLGRLVVAWTRGYLSASRNSACAATLYSALSVLPTALVGVASFHLSSDDSNAFADRIVAHLRLGGDSAGVVHDTFANASANAVAASVAAILGFLLWGMGIGQIFRDVYARAWRVEVGSSASDMGRSIVFFFVLAAAVGLAVASASELRGRGWVVLLVVWAIGSIVFWLWTPAFLLRRAVPLRALLPGALLAAFVVGGAIAFAPLYLAPVVNKNGAAFGPFGIALTLVAYWFVLVTLAMLCMVFAPVWAEWRRAGRAPALQVT